MVALEVRETKRWQWGVRNIYVGGARSRVRWRAGETGGEDHEVLVKHGCSAPPPSRDPRCAGKQPDRHAQAISPGGTVNSSLGLQCHFHFPVPELIKVIPAPLWWDAIPFIDKLLLLPRGHLQDETTVQKPQIY